MDSYDALIDSWKVIKFPPNGDYGIIVGYIYEDRKKRREDGAYFQTSVTNLRSEPIKEDGIINAMDGTFKLGVRWGEKGE